MKIRVLAPEDINDCIRLFIDTVHQVNRNDYSPQQLAAWAPESTFENPRWQSLFENYGFVCELDGEILGFIDMDETGYIDRLFVHKDWQGQGIASKLYQQCQQKAQQLGFDELHTDASITAKPFFEAKGFKLVKEQQVDLRGTTLTNFKMSKPLKH